MKQYMLAILAVLALPAVGQSVNPSVTQANIHQTVCVRGWTSSVRPTVAYTNRVKYLKCKAAGITRTDCHDNYVLDHVEPLEVGGAPADPANLQLQTKAASRIKDGREHAAKNALCSGKISLAQAQARFSR